MVGKAFIAIVAGMVALGAALAVAALYVDWQAMMAPPTSPQGPVAGQGSPAPEASRGAAGEPAGPTPGAPQPTAEAANATKTPAAESVSVPTFDVVVVEPNGEGVIAGRATPGWTVSVQSGGTKVGEAKADLQGEWSVVLEKPLAAGDHSLSLKITSPDGRLALSSQESVRVAVGADAKAGVPPAEAPSQTGAALTSQQTSQAAAAPPPAAESDTTRALARSEQPAAAEGGGTGAVPPGKPKLVFKTVDYVDKGSGAGTVTITGTSEPGAEISITYGNESLAKTRADREGNWTIAIAKTLGMGQHSFRAERAGEPAGMAGAAVVTLERVEPKPEPPATAVATATPAPAPQVAADQSQGIGSKIIYVIRRGDTLWAIAKRYLGSGLRYTSIFQDNRTTISNPDLIHPKQEVKVSPR